MILVLFISQTGVSCLIVSGMPFEDLYMKIFISCPYIYIRE
jgi:hypothetical protein